MTTKPVILIVDDEPQMVGVISYAFQVEGFDVLPAYDGNQALQQLKSRHVHLIILDVMLQGEDGLSLCAKIRQTSTIPILLLSAKSDQADIIIGLEKGADDYMGKPFSTRELILRAKAILRRTGKTAQTIHSGPLTIDLLSYTVTLDNELVKLTPLSFRLLAYLAQNMFRPIPIQELIKEVWEADAWQGGSEMVKVEIYRLRKKIESADKSHRFIQTIRGVGYQFISHPS